MPRRAGVLRHRNRTLRIGNAIHKEGTMTAGPEHETAPKHPGGGRGDEVGTSPTPAPAVDKVVRGGDIDGPAPHRKKAPDRDNETGTTGGGTTPPATDPPPRGGH